jgi:hypothetical protein
MEIDKKLSEDKQNRKNKYLLPYIFYILFWFFGFSAAFFVLVLFLRVFVFFSLVMFSQMGFWGLFLIILFFLFFILPLFLFYLAVHFVYTRFYNLFFLPKKYNKYIKFFLYLFNYFLIIFIFQKFTYDLEKFFVEANIILINIITFILIFVIDYFCEKIYFFIKNKFTNQKKIK